MALSSQPARKHWKNMTSKSGGVSIACRTSQGARPGGCRSLHHTKSSQFHRKYPKCTDRCTHTHSEGSAGSGNITTRLGTEKSPPETGTLLTSTLQPPAQGPDHFGTPEPLEAGSQVPVVPLQRAHLHNPADTRSSGPRPRPPFLRPAPLRGRVGP